VEFGAFRWCRAGAVLVLVGAASLPLAMPAGGQEGLQLDPATGPAGREVDAAQHALPDWCTVYELRWGGLFGASLGTDDASDGVATLTFRVPQAAPGTYQISGSCRQPSGGAIPVGQATFEVTPGSPTTTAVTVPGSTTTTTTRAPTTTTSTSQPASSVPPSTTTPSTATSSTAPPMSTTSVPDATTTTTAPPVGHPPPAPVPTTLEECEDQARQAAAQLVYEPERRMTVGGTYDVIAALALSKEDLAIAEPIPSSSPTTMVLVTGARCTVEAELTGSAFDVTPDGPRAQSFVDTRVLTWQWQVTPRRTGAGHKLLLRLQSKIHEPDGAGRNGRDVFHESVITVSTEPVSAPERLGRWINGAAGNEVVRYLLLPGGSGVVATWVWRIVRRRREGSAQGGGAGIGPGVAG
jgi:hypothetical protein